MCEWGTHENKMNHTSDLEVVDVVPSTGEEPGVLNARNGVSEQGSRHTSETTHRQLPWVATQGAPDEPASFRLDSRTVTAPRSLGKVGAWLGLLNFQPANAEREIVSEIEELGYGSIWIGESPTGKEILSHAGLLLSASSRIVVATGIANIWARDPLAMETGARTLGEAYPGRFILGMGVSHSPLVQTRGHAYERPVSRMRAFLEQMDFEREYHLPAPPERVPRILAALRPAMLELAAELTDGAHPYFVPVEHTRRAREILGPGKLLIPEQGVLLETDPTVARQAAREHAAFYLGATNYVESLRSLGWTDADLAGGGSDALLDAIVAWGDEDAILARIRAHFDAGADHVCIQPVTADRHDIGLAQLRQLAPALTKLHVRDTPLQRGD
jgi:probable F420-dependent oxidoreductase